MVTANTNTDLRNGVNGDVGCKYPCKVASMVNIDLEGTQTINGVSVAENDIVLVNAQDDSTENGVYVVSTGSWERGVWFNSQMNVAPGTLVVTTQGDQYANTIWETLSDTDPIDFGTSEITFSPNSVASENANLVALAGLIGSADKLAYFTGVGAMALTDLTAYARTILATADSAAFIAALGLGTASTKDTGTASGNVPLVGTSSATEALAGTAGIANQTEANTGTDDTRIITPLKLSSKPGLTVQQVNTQTGTFASGTTAIPYDNTIPQNTEGDQYMSLAITPKSASNILQIDVVIQATNSANALTGIAALFQDSIANALASTVTFKTQAPVFYVMVISYRMVAGTTSSTTFKVRAGTNTGNAFYFNGNGGSLFGGTLSSSITITEYQQ